MLALTAAVLAALAAAAACLASGPDSACSITLVESVPENLTFNSTISHRRTFDAYKFLVQAARSELNFAELYWTLRARDMQPPFPDLAKQGDELFNMIANSAASVRIAYNLGGFRANASDVTDLAKLKHVQAVGLNFTRLFGSGVLHTKAVIADRRHAYVGSSNMDWRSLTQIQELGLLFADCPTLSDDLNKIFETYFLAGQRGEVPSEWPSQLIGGINATNPWRGRIGGFEYAIFIGASPSALCPPNRSRDIDAMLSAIDAAEKFVHVAVMDYEAATYDYSSGRSVFWAPLDVSLRTAAYRGVLVRLLVSHWRHSSRSVVKFVRSLTALNGGRVRLEGKFYTVPSFSPEQLRIPYSRVNHNKFIVTEKTAVICTSNFEGSYFSDTAGVAVSISEVDEVDEVPRAGESLVSQANGVFMRDWTSEFAHKEPQDAGVLNARLRYRESADFL